MWRALFLILQYSAAFFVIGFGGAALGVFVGLGIEYFLSSSV